MDNVGVQIIGFGACTPIGRTVWASAAAARAGSCGFSEHPFMVDTSGEPMRIARASWVDVTVQGIERYRELLFPAIDEALNFVPASQPLSAARLGLAVALPPVRPGRPGNLAGLIAGALADGYAGRFATTVTFENGHAAGHVGLDAALRSLSAGSTDAYVIAGVDSYLTPETLEWIEASEQLHGAGPLNNAWGFVPGEAASAMLISTEAFAADAGADVYGHIVSVGLARETNLIKTDAVCVGTGLTAAFQAALAGLAPDEQIDNVFCDLNGETYRADEYGFTALRTKERFRAATDFVAPADCWGDVGAASAPLHIAMAAIGHRKRYAKGPVSMTWASSESGERGAAIIRGSDVGER